MTVNYQIGVFFVSDISVIGVKNWVNIERLGGHFSNRSMNRSYVYYRKKIPSAFLIITSEIEGIVEFSIDDRLFHNSTSRSIIVFQIQSSIIVIQSLKRIQCNCNCIVIIEEDLIIIIIENVFAMCEAEGIKYRIGW